MLLKHVPNWLPYLQVNKAQLRQRLEYWTTFLPSSGGEPNIFVSIQFDSRRCSLKVNRIARAKVKPNFSTFDGTKNTNEISSIGIYRAIQYYQRK